MIVLIPNIVCFCYDWEILFIHVEIVAKSQIMRWTITLTFKQRWQPGPTYSIKIICKRRIFYINYMFKLFIYLFMTVKKVLYSPWSNYCTKFLVQIQIFMFHAIDAVLNKNEHEKVKKICEWHMKLISHLVLDSITNHLKWKTVRLWNNLLTCFLFFLIMGI